MSAPFSQCSALTTGNPAIDALTWWEREAEGEAFRRIREAVGNSPANTEHVAEYACDVVTSMLRERVERSTTSLTQWRLGHFTSYYRPQSETDTRVVATQVWLAPDSPLTDDGLVVVIGAKMPLPWAVEELHRLGESLDQWELPAPADWLAINGDDGSPDLSGSFDPLVTKPREGV